MPEYYTLIDDRIASYVALDVQSFAAWASNKIKTETRGRRAPSKADIFVYYAQDRDFDDGGELQDRVAKTQRNLVTGYFTEILGPALTACNKDFGESDRKEEEQTRDYTTILNLRPSGPNFVKLGTAHPPKKRGSYKPGRVQGSLIGDSVDELLRDGGRQADAVLEHWAFQIVPGFVTPPTEEETVVAVKNSGTIACAVYAWSDGSSSEVGKMTEVGNRRVKAEHAERKWLDAYGADKKIGTAQRVDFHINEEPCNVCAEHLIPYRKSTGRAASVRFWIFTYQDPDGTANVYALSDSAIVRLGTWDPS